jgi:hypothetical protein
MFIPNKEFITTFELPKYICKQLLSSAKVDYVGQKRVVTKVQD